MERYEASGIVHILKKVMAVFERPARHLPARALQWQAGRSRSGEAGGRYLKKNSTGSCIGHRGGVYTVEALGVSICVI